jgi:hypothetical protein
LARFEFESTIVSFSFSFIFVHLENRVCLSRGVGDKSRMACSDEDHGRSRRPGAEDKGWSHRSGTRWTSGREVGRRPVRSTPCTSRRGARVFWLSLKTKVDGLSVVWTQNHWDGFFRFHLKIDGDGFSLFGLQTSGRFFG